MVYAVGRDGHAMMKLDRRAVNLQPLFQMIVDKVPPPKGDPNAPLQIVINNIDHDDYVGRLAIGRVAQGTIKANQNVGILKDGVKSKATIKVL